MSTVPDLISKSISPPSLTLYLKEPIGAGLEAKTGLFIPQDYKAGPTVDLIVYVHGHKVRIVKKDFSIEEIWGLEAFPMRQQLNGSGKQYILAAPTLGALSEFGNLTTKGDEHLENLMAALKKYGPHDKLDKPPTIGKLVIAGHSGGGNPMLGFTSGLKTYKDNIIEIWGIDVMYGPVEEDWLSYGKNNPKVRMYFYYNDTKSRSLTLAKMAKNLKNVYVFPGESEHDLLVKTHFPERLNCIQADCQEDERRREATIELVSPKPKPAHSSGRHQRSHG